MSKSIVIQQRGTPIDFNADAVRTPAAGSGTERWVFQGDITTGTITITGNGTYNASADDLYGYTEVVVNVHEVKGKKNGKTYVVTVNEEGYLVYTEVT